MNPTAALPLHFTLETAAMSSVGLVVAWAALRRDWLAAAASASFVIAQALHAGQYVAGDDDIAVIVLRAIGLVGLAATVLPSAPERELFGGALAALAVGTLTSALTGGGAADMSLVPHLFMLAGAIAILVWVWRAARPSVRLRVLAAFISVLAMTVLVAGGAVSRAAALDSRRQEQTRLGRNAAALFQQVRETHDAVRRRAATLSPTLSLPVEQKKVTIDVTGLFAREWQVVTDRDLTVLAQGAGASAPLPLPADGVAALPIVSQARAGRVVSTATVAGDGLTVIAAAPIYRAGTQQRPEDVTGVVIVGRVRTPAELQTAVGDPDVEVVIEDGDATVTTGPKLDAADLAPGQRVRFDTLRDDDERFYAASVALPGGQGLGVIASRDDNVVNAATALVRAFLTAILAATLLAVVAALWLSARLTRPLLALADDAERVKTEFLSSVSHELRTPLTPILGYTDLLRRGRIPVNAAGEYLDEIGTAAHRLERIMQLLVDVASLEAGRFPLELEELSPNELLTDAAERWKGRVKRGTFVIDAPKTVPDVKADASSISRVLHELIDNAVKFGPDKKVHLTAEKTGDGVKLSIRDEGPGMSEEALQSATDSFTQGDQSDTRRFGGLGLGLTFVEGVLDAHKVRLNIDTAQGEGTTVSFTLPAVGSVTRMSAKAASRKR